MSIRTFILWITSIILAGAVGALLVLNLTPVVMDARLASETRPDVVRITEIRVAEPSTSSGSSKGTSAQPSSENTLNETSLRADAIPSLESMGMTFQAISSELTPSVVSVEAMVEVDFFGSRRLQEEWFRDREQERERPNELDDQQREDGDSQQDGGRTDSQQENQAPESSEEPRRSYRHPKVSAMGSGVVLSQDGFILTNAHVIDGASQGDVRVTLADNREYDAVIVGTDPSTDIAVLKIQAKDLSAVTVGDSDGVAVGDWVLAIGNPFRLRSTVTAGIVSALSRQVEIIEDALSIESFIQTDAAINTGNSGGALVNLRGELVGINTAIASRSGSYQGYGFAVPSNLALKVATDIIELGEAQRGLLGVTIASVNNAIAQELALEEVAGVLVVGVVETSDAYNHLQTEDVIVAVNDVSVRESNQLQERIALHRPGETVQLTLLRNGQRIQRSVTLMGSEALR
ncbi:MAG: trypsin-like peptidase domain-containing protein [Bacteroidetes bacterium]|nr:trypsin-like peptidase domain-containing protein [Bacteroidota bacterium]MDA0906697.1 trypsin-like peptidase domain-containing protein [Bacteroidota bacterium]